MVSDSVAGVSEDQNVQGLLPLGRYIVECGLFLTLDIGGGLLKDSRNQTYEVVLQRGSPYLRKRDVQSLRDIRKESCKYAAEKGFKRRSVEPGRRLS